MRQGEQKLVRQISQLEKQIGNRGDRSELLKRAMAEVFQEATTEELRVAAGSGKHGVVFTSQEVTAMHELFLQRAEEKVAQHKREDGESCLRKERSIESN